VCFNISECEGGKAVEIQMSSAGSDIALTVATPSIMESKVKEVRRIVLDGTFICEEIQFHSR
jgi:hypothetical protein